MEHRLGIVLSGGGARGLAHVGVLQALGEHGIEPTCVAGSSAGALVGALYAAGYSPDEMLAFFETKSPFRIANVALGKPGWIDTEKIVADFLEYFPEDSFAALGKQLFVTATDLLDGRAEVLGSGPLVRAVLASCSVPLVFTPTEIDGRLLSDGGIVDNFPVAVLEDRCEAIIGVYANPLPRVEKSDLKTSLAVSQRAFEVGMYHHSRHSFERCDVLLCPEALSEYGTFDTKHLREIRDIGHACAIEQIDAIRAALAGHATGKEPGTDGPGLGAGSR